MRFITYLATLLFAVLLAACGGGGGSPGLPSGGATTCTAPQVLTNGVCVTPASTEPVMTVSVVNAQGVAVTGISLGGGFVARATLKDATGTPIVAKLVTFAVDGSTIAGVSPLTALTNASGVAEVAIAPISVSSIGAASLTATADVSGTAAVGKTDFAVQSSSLTLSSLTVNSSSLPSGGNTSVQVTAMIGGSPATGIPVNVSFTASCGRINGQDTTAGGVSVTTTGSGVASAVYDAVGADGSLCSGTVVINAASAGAQSQSKTITVAAPVANAIVFVSATPEQIFVAGSGALDQSILKFKVLSSGGAGLGGVGVRFSIVTNPGGVGLSASGSTTPVTVETLSSGEASVAVFSGTIPGPVKVRAELVSNSSVFASSQNITVASGAPSQRFMSLSVETFNIEGWEVDGSSTQLTARVADRQGNSVADGTVINFTAEGGQVARSCATSTVNGISQCSVTFISQNPRPAGGRASVLAYIEGTKDYVDANGNNKYDAAVDTLLNIGDAYRDDNENGTFDAGLGEFLLPRGGVMTCTGSGEPFPSRVNTCDSNLATTVRQQAVILFSSSNPVLELTSASAGGVSFILRSSVNTLLPLPAGTTISATTIPATSDGECAVDKVYGSPVVNVNPRTDPAVDLAVEVPVMVSLKDCGSMDKVAITVTVPSKLATQFFVTIP